MRRIVTALTFVVALGCRADGAHEQPVEGHLELCCRSGGPLEFSGCRTSGQCRTGESIWLRGPASCGPVDQAACAGGRCCMLDVPGTDLADGATTPTGAGNPSDPEPIAVPEPEPATPPPPATIEPVPFE